MAEMLDEEEVQLAEEDKLLIMERVVKLFFSDIVHKEPTQKESSENPRKYDIEHFYKTGQLSKEDRKNMIDLAYEDFLKDIEEYKDEINQSHEDISQEDEVKLMGIVDNINSGNSNEDINEPRTISKQDSDSIKNILNSIEIDNCDSICDMPTRPNSRCISQVRDLNPNENDCSNTAINIQKPHGKNENRPHAGPNTNMLEKSIEAISQPIIEINDDCYSNFGISNTSLLFDQVEYPKHSYWGVDQLQADSAATNNKLKIDSCTDIAVIKKTNITHGICEEIEITDDDSSESGRLIQESFRRNETSPYLNKCIIEENSYNFSKFKTPMNDSAGPFFINKKEVLVDTYQDGLNDRWNPTQVVYELCSQLVWPYPFFYQHHYSKSKGFHFGVSVKDYHFIPRRRAGNKKQAKHYASTFFLQFLGFKFRYGYDDEQSVAIAKKNCNSHDDTEHKAIEFKNTVHYRNYYKTYEEKKRKHNYHPEDRDKEPNYKPDRQYTSNVYFSTTQKYRPERAQTRYDLLNLNKRKAYEEENQSKQECYRVNRFKYNTKIEASRSQYLPGGGSRVGNSLFTRVMSDFGFLPKTGHKRHRSSSSSSIDMPLNGKTSTTIGRKRR